VGNALGASAVLVTADFDPLCEEFARDPHATWKRLRATCPVARGARWDFWALTRYDDVAAASSRPADFTSSEGIVVPPNPVSGRRAPLHFDPPEHARYRRPLNGLLRDENIAARERRIRDLCVEHVQPFVERGGGELMFEAASPFVGLVFTEFLNIPRVLADQINRMGERFETAQAHFDAESAERENQALYAVCRQLVAERRAAPLDPEQDAVSALLAVRVEGEPLDGEFIAGSLRQLLIAAHVAPTALIGSAVLRLARDELLQGELRTDTSRLPAVVEEFLRVYAPNQGFARTATRDVEIRGRRITKGERVALVLPSANRDPDVFDDPERFDADRDPNPHLAFGHGPHKCPGATVGRLEVRVFLEELLARSTGFGLSREPTMLGWPVFGPELLPLRVVPR
jgi:cytochrome P450